MRIAIATDAWLPQVNGVVRTLRAISQELTGQGHELLIISPDQFASLPCPGYPEIRLAMATARSVGRRIAAFQPDAIHIATEGPIGAATRRVCLDAGYPFTTAYHTQFPEYLAQRTYMPVEWFWRLIVRFHKPSVAVLASTPSVARTLQAHGLHSVSHWGRGVDLDLFRPDRDPCPLFTDLPRPIQLYVGRVAIEKNLSAFLETRHPGTRVIVGDGPARAALEKRFPDAVFLGPLHGDALAEAYAGADVFVFPSLTDTFGLVMIEALACGTPVAAFPVPGPLDVLRPGSSAMSNDLEQAIADALACDRAQALTHGRMFSWTASARQFLEALQPIRHQRRAA